MTATISEEYRAEQQELHKNPKYGVASLSFAPVAGPLALAIINGEVTRQALFIAYLDDFKLMMIVTLSVLPLLFLMRRGAKPGKQPAMAMD